jgi:PKD repeat protein
MACVTYAGAEFCNKQCAIGGTPISVSTTGDYGETTYIYLLATNAPIAATTPAGLGMLVTIYPEDGWVQVYSGFFCVGYTTTCKIKVESANYTSGELDFSVSTDYKQCYLTVCSYALVPKVNACGELGAARVHALARISISPADAVGATLAVDGVSRGTVGASGIDVCLTEGSHTFSFQKTGYATATGTFSILSGESKLTTAVPLLFSMTALPVANFTAAPTGGIMPLSVAFTNTSTNATSYSWTFGDGATSTLVNPSHVYTVAGTYTVTLVVSNSGGSNTITKSNHITVIDPSTILTANFTSDAINVVQGTTVHFYETSTGDPIYWQWAFALVGGATFYKYERSPTIIFWSAGTYNISLTVTSTTSSNTVVKNGYLVVTPSPLPAPVVDFTANPVYGRAPLTVQFTDLTTNYPLTWAWWIDDGGSGINFSNVQNPLYTFAYPGSYSITLQARNAKAMGSIYKANFITAVDLLPAHMVEGTFDVQPRNPHTGETFTATQIVNNAGEMSGDATVTFTANGVTQVKTTTIASGGTATLSASFMTLSTGTVTVCGNLT